MIRRCLCGFVQLDSARRFFSASRLFKLDDSAFETFKCSGPPKEVQIDLGVLVEAYKQMALIRRMEMAADSLYKEKLARGFLHLYIGQEAVATGINAALTPKDAIITAYRCHAFALLRGNSVDAILAELLGRATGVSKGKGGSMHLYGDEFYGGNGIVGAQVPIGAGIAFAQKFLGEKACCFTLYGDGAANNGQVFETFNIAKLWSLPCVFVCENNRFGMGTSVDRASASTEFYKRGDFIAGVRVDGMDFAAIYAASLWARDWAISGKGPVILEMDTYRYQGHSVSDPGTSYRTRKEIKQVRQERDPKNILKQRILAVEAATEQEIEAFDAEAKEQVQQAMEKAKNAPFPKDSELFTDV